MFNTDHEFWKPTTKFYYKRYHTCIHLGPFSKSVCRPRIPREYSGEYRLVNRWDPDVKNHSKVYTSNQDLIDFILNDSFLALHVKSISGPANQEHLDALKDADVNVVFRDNLWYSQYRLKVLINPRRGATDVNSEDFWKTIYDTFSKDSRISHRSIIDYNVHVNRVFATGSLWNTSWHHGYGYTSMPAIYTNNESSIMLLKLSMPQDYRVTVERCILLQDFTKG